MSWGEDDDSDDEDGVVQVVWATNADVASDDVASGWPIDTVRYLPPDGIVVCASMAPEVADGHSLYPERPLPLTLADGDFFAGQYENQAASHVSVYRVSAHVEDQYITAEVFFGVPEPGSAVLRAAEAQLSRLVLAKSTSGDGD